MRGVVRRAMEFACALDIPLIEHCEDLHLSAGGDMHEGFESTRLGLRGIPHSSEDVMVARDILLAEVTGVRYHVAHISSHHSVEMVAFAKHRGIESNIGSHAASFRFGRYGHAAVRQQLQDEAAATRAQRREGGDERANQRGH